MKDSGKTLDGKKFEYEIIENGYIVYLGGDPIFRWRSINKLDEDECEKLALEKIETLSYIPPEPEPTAEEQLRADVDYLAAMTGVEL